MQELGRDAPIRKGMVPSLPHGREAAGTERLLENVFADPLTCSGFAHPNILGRIYRSRAERLCAAHLSAAAPRALLAQLAQQDHEGAKSDQEPQAT